MRPRECCASCAAVKSGRRGYELKVGSTNNLPPCRSCHNGRYDTVTGGDSKDDPYPDRS